MSYVIRCAGLAGIHVGPGDPSKPVGGLLKEFDVDAMGGRGTSDWTVDPEEALHFESPEAAHKAWTTQSTVAPLRQDGQPNRPLTAYTVEILPLSDFSNPRGFLWKQ